MQDSSRTLQEPPPQTPLIMLWDDEHGLHGGIVLSAAIVNTTSSQSIEASIKVLESSMSEG